MDITEKRAIVIHRLTKAKKTLEDAEFLFINKLWNATINRLYYAGYYSAGALLINSGYDIKTDSGVLKMFEKHFVFTGIVNSNFGRVYSKLFELKEDDEFGDLIEFNEVVEVAPLLKSTRQLIQKVEEILSKQYSLYG